MVLTIVRASRSQFDRLLDPKQISIKLETMQRAAATILGERIHLDLVDAPSSR